MSDGHPPISTSFYLATAALAAANGSPLPKGISETTAGDWKLAINVGAEPQPFNGQTLDPYTVFAENTVYFGFAIFGPYEGMIGGIPEDQFLADLRAAGFTEETQDA